MRTEWHCLQEVEPPRYQARASIRSSWLNRVELTRYYTRGEALSIGSSIRSKGLQLQFLICVASSSALERSCSSSACLARAWELSCPEQSRTIWP